MMTGNTAIHIASQLQSGAPRKAAFLVAVLFSRNEAVPITFQFRKRKEESAMHPWKRLSIKSRQLQELLPALC